MFKNYIKIALRNILNQKGYSFINFTGLAIGLVCVILIILWIQDELSFDKFHKNSENIYRVILSDKTYKPSRNYPVTPPALAKALKKDYPEVVSSAKYYDRGYKLIKYGENKFKEHIAYTDPSIFDIFTFKFLQGNPETVLDEPFSMVITQSTAKKYFGDQYALNKTLTIDNKYDFKITGIIKDFPKNSTLMVNFIINYEHIVDLIGDNDPENWSSWGIFTYVKLSPNTDVKAFENKISDYPSKHFDYQWKPSLLVQSFSDIHLKDVNGGGIITYVYIFGIIAAFILIIACINFMNLATARSALRAKEIGLRKVIGAGKSNLIRQFYGESILISFISLFFSLFLTELLLPVFNNLSGKTLSLDFINNPVLIPILLVITLITGLISGSYPALYLSSIQPIQALKGSKLSSSSLFRKVLVTFQFVLSIVLIFSTIVVFNQLHYMSNQYLGFNKDMVVYTPLNRELQSKYELVQNELLQDSNIENVCATSSHLGIHAIGSIDINKWDGNDGEKSILTGIMTASYNFLETFDIDLVSGRFFSKQFSSDTNAVVFNETAIKQMGLEKPIGQFILDDIKIIGVVKDFNFESLKSKIRPLAIFVDPGDYMYFAIKISNQNTAATIGSIRKTISKFAPNYPFEYHFLDEEFDKMYKSEQQLGKIFNYFAILAILISCLGLIGLASFIAQRRTKEIGVRKVLGSSIFSIITLLSKDFTKLIILSNIIAWPIAWFVMNNWLQNFAYRIDIAWWFFGLSGIISLLIALSSVILQAVKAATANPIKSLRYE